MVRPIFAAACLAAIACAPALSAEEAAPPPEPPKIAPREPATLPPVVDGRVTREVSADRFRIQLDLTDQVLYLDVPKEDSWRAPDELRAGDTIELTRDTTLRSRRTVVARVAKGRRLVIAETQDQWVRLAVIERGQTKLGWVDKNEVRLVADEPPVHPTLAGLGDPNFISAAMLA
jgi:hypothetical protein